MRKIEEILDACPFMYEIEGEIYALGQETFDYVGPGIGIKYFLDYQEIQNRRKSENIKLEELDKKLSNDLMECVKEVIVYSKMDYAYKAKDEVYKELRRYIAELSDEGMNQLLEQFADFKEIYNHYKIERW